MSESFECDIFPVDDGVDLLDLFFLRELLTVVMNSRLFFNVLWRKTFLLRRVAVEIRWRRHDGKIEWRCTRTPSKGAGREERRWDLETRDVVTDAGPPPGVGSARSSLPFEWKVSRARGKDLARLPIPRLESPHVKDSVTGTA